MKLEIDYSEKALRVIALYNLHEKIEKEMFAITRELYPDERIEGEWDCAAKAEKFLQIELRQSIEKNPPIVIEP